MLDSAAHSRKKKGRFSLIPIPGTEQHPSGQTPTQGQSITADSMLKKAAVPMSGPSGHKVTPQTYQMRSTLAGNDHVVTDDESGREADPHVPLEGPADAVSHEALRTIWLEFAEAHLADRSRSLYTTLTAEIPDIEGNTISFRIHNGIQEKELNDLRGELMEFLRGRLNNVTLQLILERVEHHEVKKEFLSDREKYNRFAAKNPLLEELRKRFNLDLD